MVLFGILVNIWVQQFTLKVHYLGCGKKKKKKKEPNANHSELLDPSFRISS